MHARHSKLAVFARATGAAMLLFASACGSDEPGGGGTAADQGATSGSTGTSGGSNPQTTGSSTVAGTGSGGSGPTSSENTGGAGGSNSESSGGAGGALGGANPVTMGNVFGPVHTGSYNNGPVDFSESVYHNACAPKEKYAPQIQELYGPYLGGIDNSLAGDGSLCDACALLTTRLGKSVLVHLVTYGVSKAPGDMDLSPAAYDAVYESDPMGTPSIPRPMSWQLARCPDAGNHLFAIPNSRQPLLDEFLGAQREAPHRPS